MLNHIYHRPVEPRLDDRTTTLDQHRLRALGMLLLAASVAVPVVALSIFLREGITPLTLLVCATCALIWLLGFLYRRGRVNIAAHGLVLIVLSVATASIVLSGGVRSAGVFVLMASMVLAGTFLSQTKMIAVVLYCIVALGVINWLEQRGMLLGALPSTDWTVWVVQTVVIAIVLISALAGQYRLQVAFDTQREALNLAHDAEAALRASQEHFEALFRNNPAACFVQSTDTNLLVDTNEAYVQMSGFSRDDLVGRRPPQLWADPAQEEAFRTSLKTHGRVSSMHARGLRRDGSQFDSMVYAELIQQGNEELMMGMVLDMSAEEKSRERFTRAFQHSPICMTLTRLADGRYLEVNSACERVLGGRPEDYVGKTSLETGVWLNPQVRADYVNTMRREGRLQAYDTQIQNRQGEVVDVQVWAEIIDIDGEPCALTFVLNVAEERRRRAMLLETAKGVSGETGEPFFRSLVTHMAQTFKADLVIAGEINQPGSVQTVAAYFDGRIVPNIQYELEGTPCSHAVRVPGGQCFYAEHLAERFPTDDFPIDGGFETYVGVALRDADGTPIGILKALWTCHQPLSPDLQALLTIFSSRCNAELIRLRRDREIQKLRETLEQRVIQRTSQLEMLNRELDTFAYSVSHDLKSPLRSIDGFMHLLKEQMHGHMTAEDEVLMNRVMGSTVRMNGLINDLLALARVSQSHLQPTLVNLSQLAEDVIRQEMHRDPTREVTVLITPKLLVQCDPRMAQIVLENLLGNAWKYSRNRASACIELGSLQAEGDASPFFFVRDNGAGFDMGRSDRLFKPFNRLHAANEFEGSGIGLATVRRIIERHGGWIRGEGAVGAGATFQFSFGQVHPENS